MVVCDRGTAKLATVYSWYESNQEYLHRGRRGPGARRVRVARK